MIKGLITSKNFVFIALLTLAGLALTWGAGPLATSTAYAESIWTGAEIPLGAYSNDGKPIEVGVKFRADVNGYITGLRFYKAAGDTGIHVGSLWKTDGTLYEAVTFTGETASGWQQMLFESPVPITTNTTYVASYYSSLGNYAADSGYFATAGLSNGQHLYALANSESSNGVFKLGGGFPDSSYNSTNYWVDVVFSTTVPPDTTPPTVSSVSPTNGAVGVNTGVNITATFSEAMDPATISASSFELLDSLSNLVSTSVTYNAATKIAVLNPAAPLSLSAVYTATVKGGASGVKDLRSNPMTADLTWSFTTGSQTVFTIWNDAVVPVGSYDELQPIEVGVKFQADVAGYITGLRFYKAAGDPDPHIGNLWSSTGSNLATVTFTGETASGWQEMAFGAPVLITANTTYVASYYSPSGNYAADLDYFGTAYNNPPSPLHALADDLVGPNGPNGIYIYGLGGGFPNSSGDRKVNYWVDVTFTRIPRTLTANANGAGAGTVSSNVGGISYTYPTKNTGQATLDDGTAVTVTATAAPGSTVAWGGACDSTAGGGSGVATCTINSMNSAKTVTATFTQIQYTVTVTSNPAAGGSVGKSPNKATYVYGDVVQLTASANAGYTFSSWTGDATGTTNPVNVTVDGNKSVTANFAINTYTLSYLAGSNGSISGTTPQTVNYGASGTAVTAVPATGYHFVQWSDGSTVNPRTDTNVTANITVTASFAIDQNTVSASVTGGNGTVSPASQQINYGANASVTITPDAHYHIASITDNGTPVAIASPYVINNVTAAHTVVVSFAIDQNTVSASVTGGNGTVSPASQQINYGANASVTITPDADRKSTRLNSSHSTSSRMTSYA